MNGFEYKVIPAPSKGLKAPGVKGPEARFAHALETAMNEMAAEGWEYLRADILPSEERQGLTSTHIVYRSVLVFRRAAAEFPETSAEDEAPPPAEDTEISETEIAEDDFDAGDDTVQAEPVDETQPEDKS